MKTVKVTVYLHPLIFKDSAVLGPDADESDPSQINGSGNGDELENPVRGEWDSFVEDCIWLVKEVGFTVIRDERNESPEKAGRIITFGTSDVPRGRIALELRVSERPFDVSFPEIFKERVSERLKMDLILDGAAADAGIDFQVDKVRIGKRKMKDLNDSFNLLYRVLKRI